MKSKKTRHMQPAAQIASILHRIYAGRLTTSSGGNISILDKHGNIWITPAAIDKGSITEKDIVCIQKDGKTSGIHRPSSELPFHRAIYTARPDIRAIIHAHSPALVSFSIVHQVPDTTITPHVYTTCGIPGYASYELPGSSALGDTIASVFNRQRESRAIILENHGVVVGGTDLVDSFQCFETLENAACILINARKIGKPVQLTNKQLRESLHHPDNESGVNQRHRCSYGERKHRKEMVRFVRRACSQGLMTSTQGTLSVRLGANDFLITPHSVSRREIQPGDILPVRNGKLLKGKDTHGFIQLHNEIYRNCANVNAIFQAQPPNLMAFAITGESFDTRTIPESWIFLQDIPYIPPESLYKRYEVASRLFSTDAPAAFIMNDSFLMTGCSIMDAFDKLEIAEFTAQSIIMAKDMGTIIPITDEQIDELRIKFLS
ncbi:MAG: class II aldolase/adducin family protein [Spirochaetota bacterium]